MEIDFIQRFGLGRVPDSAFQDILVDTRTVTKAGVCMPGGVGCISGELPGKLRFTLAVFVIRIWLDADFLQERIELAVTPVLFIPEIAFSIKKERTVFRRGGIRMFKNRDAKVKNGNDAVASGLGLAAANQISTGFRAVKIFVFEVQQLIDTNSVGQKSNYHLPGGRVLLAQNQRHLFVRENFAFRRFAPFDFQDRCKVGIHDTPANGCAIQLTLETVMNLAALNSVYQGHEHIQKEDITEALLQVVYKLQKTDKETDSTELQKIAVHEAAHAVVGEVLHPGSIGIVTVRGNQGVIGGMANGCATYAQNEEEFLDEVTKTLAGRAGVSLIYGVMDIQASADIEQADKLMDIWQCHFAGGGFVGIESGDNRMSEQRLSYNEAIKSAKLEELYRRAYKILHDNRDFLLAVQKELLEHETLLNSDLAKIWESCT